jgi:aminopeptidase N
MKVWKSHLILLSAAFAFWTCQSSKTTFIEQEREEGVFSQLDTAVVEEPEERTELIRLLEYQIGNYQASRQRDFDLLHTSLELSFDYEKEWVLGNAELTLKPHFFPQTELVLDAKDFEVHHYALLTASGELPLNFRYNGNKLTAYLPSAMTRQDTIRVRIKYTAMPNENAGVGSRAITDTKGLYFINASGEEANKPTQIWTQGETEHNSKWFPTIDSPNERGTQEIKLTVDAKYRTLSNGLLQGSEANADGTRTDHWLMELSHAPYLAAVVVGDFVEIQDEWEGMQVNYYVEAEFEEGAKKVFAHTPEMIGFFSELLGVRYPWQRYDQVVVRDFVSGAMENTTISVFMEQLNLNEREAIDSEWDSIIAHELFHQWFGNYVTNESWANLTLNEAFGNYAEYLWYEYKNGKDDADMHQVAEMEQYFDEAKDKQEDLVRFYHEKGEDMFDSHSYAKGGRILHMLRRHLGDDAFFAALKYYLEKHAFSAVEVHDLRLSFEAVTGMDLNWYFNQWFLASGHPILEYEVDYSQPENLLLTVAQRQDFTNTPLYKIPFKISWYSGEERYEKELVLDKAWQQFAIENGVPVTELYVDEAKEILAKKQSYRGKHHFINQYNNSHLGVARYEALDSLASYHKEDVEVVALAGKGLQDDFWAIRELAIMKISQHPDWIVVIDNLEEQLYEIAENDAKHTVRLGAIELLSLIDGEKYAPAFLRWMNHPSYYVAGSALGAYLEEPSNANRDAIAHRFESENNIRMVVALADYYISEELTGKGDWFHERLNRLTGQSLYYYLGYYADYFAILPDEGSDAAIERLEELARTHNANYVRIAAFMGLFAFIDDAGVVEKAKEIWTGEQDDSAKQYMEFFLSSYLDEN